MITQSQLLELFDYKDGQLISKQKSKRRNVGDVLGKINDRGYVTASVQGDVYRVHRLIFFWHHGVMPEQIDHINGIRDDNRIENLRPATSSENAQNRIASSVSGTKGVYWHKQINRWVASICVNRKNIHLGSFEDIDAAKAVAMQARKDVHGSFAKGEK
jgi:hypothetical protein